MPSIHIPESEFSELVDQQGGYHEAKERVKELVRSEVSNGDEQ